MTVTPPVTLSWSYSVPTVVPFSSTLKFDPLLKVMSPVLRMPGLAPGETFEPLAATVFPVTVPVPLSVWPLTSTSVLPVKPVTSRIVLACTSIVVELARLFVNAPDSANVPPLTVVEPLNVFAPDSVVVPPVLCVRPLVPARIALTEPLCVWIVFVLVSVPPEPVMLPLVSVSVFTVSLLPTMANVEPLTFSFVLLLIRSVPPSVNVPPSSSTVCVPALSPVASIVIAPVALRNWLLLLADVFVLRLVAPICTGKALVPIAPALTSDVFAAPPMSVAPVVFVAASTMPPVPAVIVTFPVFPFSAVPVPAPLSRTILPAPSVA